MAIIKKIIKWIVDEITFELWFCSRRTQDILCSDERFSVLKNFAEQGAVNRDEFREKFWSIWTEAAEKYDLERAEERIERIKKARERIKKARERG